MTVGDQLVDHLRVHHYIVEARPTHTFTAGTHFMQVSKWLGHSTFTLTLDVYGDYIAETDGGAVNPLPEPTAPAKSAKAASNVVKLFGAQTG
jgi:hypothetical protein